MLNISMSVVVIETEMYWTFLKMWIFLHVSINIFIYFIVEKIGPVDL